MRTKNEKELTRFVKFADDFCKQYNGKTTSGDKKIKLSLVNIAIKDLSAYWDDNIKMLWNKYFCFKENINKDEAKKAKDLKDLKEINVYILEEKEENFLIKEVKKIVLF